ncbi:MAG: hypothetical protein KBF53_08645 [Sphingobium sp.]|nr:hypothetical protein [Sphingobium sp.]
MRLNFEELCRHVAPSVNNKELGLARTVIQDRKWGKFTPSNQSGLEFKISANGIAEESRILSDRGTYVFPTPPLATTWKFWRREINWTKWGAIAAWIIIPITVVGILVAVWLDKN